MGMAPMNWNRRFSLARAAASAASAVRRRASACWARPTATATRPAASNPRTRDAPVSVLAFGSPASARPPTIASQMMSARPNASTPAGTGSHPGQPCWPAGAARQARVSPSVSMVTAVSKAIAVPCSQT